jgi:hypothetical protein
MDGGIYGLEKGILLFSGFLLDRLETRKRELHSASE